MTPNPTLNRSYSIDIFRFIGACAVVLLHVSYGNLTNEVVLLLCWIGRWAVPFFFIVSGYFFYHNYVRHGDKALVNTLKKLLAIILVANLVYLPVRMVRHGRAWDKVFTLELFTSNYHLWFVNALVIGYLVLWLLLIRGWEKRLLPVAHLALLFSLFTYAYAPVAGLVIDRNFSMMVLALPLLIYGFTASKTGFFEKRFTLLSGVLIAVAGFVLQSAEMMLVYRLTGRSPHNQEVVFGSLLFALGMLVLALKVPVSREVRLAAYGRKYALPIYLYHALVIILFTGLINHFALADHPLVLWLNPFVCVLVTVSLIWLLDKKFPRTFRLINGG